MQHPLDWSRSDVEVWCVTEGLPHGALLLLSGLSGPDLWQLCENALIFPGGKRPSPAGESATLCALWDALQKLRATHECQDLLLAASFMAEEHPLVAPALDAEASALPRDYLYSVIVQEAQIKQNQIAIADLEFAGRLQQEWEREVISLRRAQEEEQTILDHELAQRVENAREDQIDAIMRVHGRDILTAPPIDDEVHVAEGAGGQNDDLASSVLQDGSECVVCLVVCADATQLPCGHFMCRSDLATLIKTALKDSAMLPVSCCQQELPLHLIFSVLSKDDQSRMHDRLREKAATNKMYCANPTCSYFINLDPLIRFRDSSTIECPSCSSDLCIHCKSLSHDGACEDVSDAQLAELAALEGWKKCKQCATFVSLKQGCNHITCICQYEFCYVCEEEWKTPKQCHCPLWYYEDNDFPPIAQKPCTFS